MLNLSSMAKRIVWIDQAKADIIGIQQPIAIQIFKTLGRYVLTGEGATKQLKGVTPPMIRLRAQDHRVYGQVFRLWPTRPPMAGEPLRSEPRKVFARAIPTSRVNLRLEPDTPGRGQLAEEVYMA